MIKQDEITPLPAGLYLVSTPIGNLRDMTLRGIDTLKACALIACEDTRVSVKLFNAYDIKTKSCAYHDHSDQKSRERILTKIKEGHAVALISDAGTPLVSDPGYQLVQDAIAAQLPIIPIPGANAPLPALQLAGLPCDRFSFCGFLPHKKGDVSRLAESVSLHTETLIFYDSARRLAANLTTLSSVLGNRQAAIVREITKRHEDTLRGTLCVLSEQATNLKGEIVLVIAGAETKNVTDEALMQMLRQAMAHNSLKSAVHEVSHETGTSRSHVYQLALSVRDEL